MREQILAERNKYSIESMGYETWNVVLMHYRKYCSLGYSWEDIKKTVEYFLHLIDE